MKGVARAADKIREQRKPAAEDNPFVKFQEAVSKNIVDVLDKWRDAQEALSETLFLGIYGSPVVQAAVGVTPDADVSPKPRMSPEHRARLEARIAELKSQIGSGGLRECVIRGLLYVGSSRGMVDERSLEALRRARASDAGSRLTLAQFKKIAREQFFMLLLEPEASLAAIPKLLAARRKRAASRPGGNPQRAVRECGNIWRGRQAARSRDGTVRSRGKIAGEGVLGGGGLIGELDMGIASIEAGEARAGAKYDRLIAAAKAIPPATTIVVHPCDESSLRGASDAAEAGIIKPILVGPSGKIRAVAFKHGIDISGFELVEAPHSEDAAAKAVELIHAAKGEMLMKGSLHTDELMRSVTAKAGGLRTERRISHVFVMDVPAYSETIFVTDAAINIFPDLDGKRDIVQNAIDLYTQAGFGTSPRVAILSAVETVTSKIPSTIEAAALCKMADRGQITGGLLDGPLAFDNAIDREAARIKGIKSEVAGRAQILVVPDLESGNMLAKNLAYFAKADGAGHRAGRPRSDRADVAGGFAEIPHGILCRCDALCRRPASPRPNSCSVTVMDTILVINAGSSSVKFQVFAVDGNGGLRRQIKGQVDGIGSRPRLRANGAAGEAVADRAYPIEAVPDVPAALMLASAWLREEHQLNPLAVGHRVVHGGPDYDRPVLIDHGVVARLEQLRGAGAVAPAPQSGADPHPACQISRAASGRLLRHGLPPRPR